MRLAAALAILSPLLGAAPATALSVEGLTEARVEVADQGAEARARAFREALAAVVVRLTGDAAAPQAPDLAPLFRNPQRFLNRYSYVEEPPLEGALDPAPRLFLLARFDPVALERGLREAGRAVWGRERPLTLAWLAIDDGAVRAFVTGEDGEAADALRKTAERRGLPLRFPAFDADDRATLSFADLWGGFEDRVLPAVARYGANFALVGAATRSGSTWQGRWMVVRRDGSFARSATQAGSLGALLADAIDAHADALAAEYAVRADTSRLAETELTIVNVADLESYARAVDYLETLSLVRGVQVARVAGDELTLRVAFAGELRHLEQTLALGSVLVADPDAFATGSLRYKYVP